MLRRAAFRHAARVLTIGCSRSSNARRPRASLSTTTAEHGMGKTIHIDVNPSHAVEIDGALVARELGLAVPELRQLMDRRPITVLCERGTGKDEGLYRASFYNAGRRLRLGADRHGMHDRKNQ